MVKRLLMFLLIIAVLTGIILGYAWLRGDTGENIAEGQITRGILYIICSAIVLSLITYLTRYIIKGK